MKKLFLITATAYDRYGVKIASAQNNYKKSHPMMKHFAEKVGLPEKEFLHAEVRTLLRCRDRVAYKLVIERYTVDGTPALAKPCPVCLAAIKAYRVQKVCYTSPEGLVEIDVKELS